MAAVELLIEAARCDGDALRLLDFHPFSFPLHGDSEVDILEEIDQMLSERRRDELSSNLNLRLEGFFFLLQLKLI